MCGPCAGGGGGRQDGPLRGPAADDQEALAQGGKMHADLEGRILARHTEL